MADSSYGVLSAVSDLIQCAAQQQPRQVTCLAEVSKASEARISRGDTCHCPLVAQVLEMTDSHWRLKAQHLCAPPHPTPLPKLFPSPSVWQDARLTDTITALCGCICVCVDYSSTPPGFSLSSSSSLATALLQVLLRSIIVQTGCETHSNDLMLLGEEQSHSRSTREGCCSMQEAGGRRQEARGKMQEAGGRRQEAGGRRHEAGSRRQEAGGKR
ncbi:unnamed protein product [Pleuronectes platessa]|uniref:Uncharacterized protein n=1 Tax=Pleuronectes platessa TaxID=8262 RepID=A0A9N7UQ16_PLEPL|nr:unnamed protein product [Pleuronectes platessa]